MDCDQCDRAPVAAPTFRPEAWPSHEFQPGWWRTAPSPRSKPRSAQLRHCLHRQRWLLRQSQPRDSLPQYCPTPCETLPAATTPARVPTPVSCPAPPELLFLHRHFLFQNFPPPSFLLSLFYPRFFLPNCHLPMRMSEMLFMWPTMFTGQRCPCHQQYSCGKRWPVHAEPCSASFPRQLKSSFPEATSTHINLY